MSASRVLASSPWDFDLIEQPDGRLTLAVLCGTVGLYEVSHELSADERVAWERDGLSYVRILARRIFDEEGARRTDRLRSIGQVAGTKRGR